MRGQINALIAEIEKPTEHLACKRGTRNLEPGTPYACYAGTKPTHTI